MFTTNEDGPVPGSFDYGTAEKDVVLNNGQTYSESKKYIRSSESPNAEALSNASQERLGDNLKWNVNGKQIYAENGDTNNLDLLA